MPTLPVIADVYRVTLNWAAVAGVTPRNVMHVRVASSDEQEVADSFIAALDPDMYQVCTSDQVLESIDVLALDGTSAGLNQPLTGFAPAAAGETVPAAAALIKLQTGFRGPRGRGRQYVGPVREACMAYGSLTDAYKAATQTAWDLFKDNLGTAGSAPLALVVASYVHADSHDVTSVSAEKVLGTQRRRQQQLR